MDIASVSSLTTALSQAKTGDAVGTLVLKKAMDIQAQNALQLLQAVPQVASNPPNLGNSIDVKA
ncbi:YjfB family protein [Ferribacterium limneticum]|uniref:YjfB family protein n=1 Tax=Ferribacterium limneticum TaxID=76259 RepID=UPI001CFA425B|nr:YjfB family protein [Ferribacterium limneticum]UCV28470.1 YjfB family protein [Ferribacterium limneticum]UCV32387.1 YjfB family protein [Ferribacterium limneticum]